MAAHIKQVYGTNRINRVVVTHPDQDHAEGLAPILEQFDVDELWMLRPWHYVDALLPHLSRYTSAQALRDRLRSDYPYVEELERIALRRGISILEPFQGAKIGPFTVLAPSRVRYFQLILQSERTPQLTPQMRGIINALMKPVAPVVSLIKAGWGSEKFSSEDASVENEMSVIQYAFLNGQKIVLTADAGREALTEAAAYAPIAGLFLPGVDRFQVPHHGGRRNISTELLDHWLGPRLRQMVPQGQELFIAMISSAKEDKDHPRKAVIRALLHRGALIATTEDGMFGVWNNAPPRTWYPLRNPPYPHEQEA
jgi:hypothetical protein